RDGRLAVAIEHGRDVPGGASLAGAALAELLPACAVQWDDCHGISSLPNAIGRPRADSPAGPVLKRTVSSASAPRESVARPPPASWPPIAPLPWVAAFPVRAGRCP